MKHPLALAAALATLSIAVLAPSAGANAVHELNIGSLAPDPSPWREVLDKIESHVETRTNGAVNVILRPPGVMGEVEMVRETRKGERLQAAGITTAALAEGGNIPVMQLLELPYLFDSFAQADKVLDGALWQPTSDALKRRGFIMGVWSENGFRSFGTKGKPIRSTSDLSGMKMRSQESDVHMAMYKAFGANAVQKPMTEVLTSLKSNVIDGLDSSPVYMLSAGLAEPLDYFTLSRHIYQPAVIVYSRRWFEGLPPEIQTILLEVKKYAPEGRKAIRDEVDATLELFPQLGMEVVTLSDAERAEFKKKGMAIHDSFAAEIEGGPEMLRTIRGAL